MKTTQLIKILFCIALAVLTSSCNSTDSYVKKFAREIIERPDRLDSLSFLYPDFIIDKYLTKEMLDSKYLKTLKNKLEKNFKRNSSGFHLYKFDDYSVKVFCKENGIKDWNFILGYVYLKKSLGIEMYFFVKDDNLYLVMVGSTFVRTELEKIYDDQ